MIKYEHYGTGIIYHTYNKNIKNEIPNFIDDLIKSDNAIDYLFEIDNSGNADKAACESGGVGSTSCSNAGCSVSCGAGYYACCNTRCTCVHALAPGND